MVNLAGKIFDKSGRTLSIIRLSSFFGTGNDLISDPRIHYDSLSGRWFASILDVSRNSIILAVSTSGDPTQPWFPPREISAGPNCPDQPWLGFSSDKVVISANVFTNHCDPNTAVFQGAQLWILNKNQLLSGFVSGVTFPPFKNRISIRPVQSLSPASTLFMVTTCRADLAPGCYPLELTSVDGVPGINPVTVNFKQIFLVSTSFPSPAQQLGTSIRVATNDNRILSAVWQNGRLWLGYNYGCVTGQGSCIRLVELDTATSTKIQDFDIGSPGDYLFYPALSIDSAGNLVVVFGRSNSAIYPELRVAWRALTDPPNTLRQSMLVSVGTGPSLSARYGDYFGAATDPSRPKTIWVAGQVGVAGSSWLTKIAMIDITLLPP